MNCLRGDPVAGINAKKPHCPAGHPGNDANTQIQANGGQKCLTCDCEAKTRECALQATRQREQEMRRYRVKQALAAKAIGPRNAETRKTFPLFAFVQGTAVTF